MPTPTPPKTYEACAPYRDRTLSLKFLRMRCASKKKKIWGNSCLDRSARCPMVLTCRSKQTGLLSWWCRHTHARIFTQTHAPKRCTSKCDVSGTRPRQRRHATAPMYNTLDEGRAYTRITVDNASVRRYNMVLCSFDTFAKAFDYRAFGTR